MTTLNIFCGICSEFFSKLDRVFATRCGHVFHQQCLFHWLNCSQTCPQCRDNCSRHRCRRLYLNFEPLNENDANPSHANKSLPAYEWIQLHDHMNEELLKTFAFHYGTNEYGDDIYAARAYFSGDLIPAYYCPKKGGVIAPWGFKSRLILRNIEILDISCDTAEYKWVKASEGSLPDNALISGHTAQKEPLYTARAEYDGSLLYGKLHRQYKMAYMPYKDIEVCDTQYEVLVRLPKSNHEKDR